MEHQEHVSCIPVDNETQSSTFRITKNGKRFTYRMSVIQQPMRARACGAGAKSSADRRPVDPPPIVELQIFEGDNTERDITFNMEANYFLFATLEQARPIAHGRMPEEKTRQATVLTGTPVAGMVYLDRPKPAGYFIFPDLSVRHEGVYRLSFSLYEELKKESDRSEEPSRPITPGDAHVTHRLEVKSMPFTVFSAKKFPGLTESTSLSRMVAEQGCRVRIRRDVRMRRRESKKDNDWNNYDEEHADARARASMTPESYQPAHPYMEPISRPRSASNASHHSLANPLSRRPSAQDLNTGYHAPQTPSGFSQTTPYGPSPAQQYSQPPYMQQHNMPPPPQFNGQQSYQPPPPLPAAGSQQSYYGGAYPPAPPATSLAQSQYPPTPSSYHTGPPRSSIDYAAEERRFSGAPPPASQSGYVSAAAPSAYGSYAPPPPQSFHPAGPLQPNGYDSRQSSYAAQDSHRPPPLQPIQPPARASGASTPLSSGRPPLENKMPPLPPLQMPHDANNRIEPASPSTTGPQSSMFSATSIPADSHKRSYGNVFPTSDRSTNRPLRQGARPVDAFATNYDHFDSDHLGDDGLGDTDGGDLNPIRDEMKYKRADGRFMHRMLPTSAGQG
ncbi:hypothetical protein EJ03DRAFT_200085 [Teratosphaeria nubilosa]|uniref:Velvet domain-containing protein n=1 Tax=Teratosphaeria nubilosa TaxID=161662 RepID=A0A6G1LH79_9PEZI|nr:hypothetical protein EJ03DRAFT_200085 [Teratosphaeria nubilosa]